MKKLLIFSILIMFKIHSLSAQNLNWEWAKQVNAASISSKADQNGNVYVTGAFKDTLTIGSFTLISNTTNSLTATSVRVDVFVAKFDPAGNVIWAKSFSGDDYDVPKDITVDNNGNCVVLGEYNSMTVTFDNFTLYNIDYFTTTNCRFTGIFITKLDFNGNVVWAKNYGTNNTYASVIKSDLNGNCYAMGYSNGGITFGDNPSGAEIGSLTTDNNGNVYATGGFTNLTGKKYVAKWNGSSWSELGGSNFSPFNGSIASIVTDVSGYLYAAGSFINASGKRYVAKWNGTSWSEVGGTNSSTFNSNIYSITTDAGGNLYAAGDFTNTIGKRYIAKWNGTSWSEVGGANTSTFNNSILSIKTYSGNIVYAAGSFTNANGKCYLAKWNGTNWSELGGTNTSTFNDAIRSITTDASGKVYAGGWFTNTNNNYYVAKWNGISWSELGGTNTSNFDGNINAITTDAAGNLYATGSFYNANTNFYVAKWNGINWSEVGGTNSSLGQPVSGILALVIDLGGNIYAGNALKYWAGNHYLAKWNGTSWTELGSRLVRNAYEQFIVKLDNFGNPLFSVKAQDAKNLTVDNNENIFTCGSFYEGPINFGNSVICCSGQLPDVNMFFAKYNSNGDELWARSAGYGDGKEIANAIGIDNSGNIVVAGSYNSSNFYGLSFSGGNYYGGIYNDLFIAKHDTVGNLIWVDALTSPMQSPSIIGNAKTVGDIAIDNTSYYIAGSFGQGNNTIMHLDTITISSTNVDLFVAKYNTNGKALCAYKAISACNDGTQDFSLDNSGNIYISGFYGTSANGGGNCPIVFGNTTLGGGGPFFVSKLGSSSTVGINTPLTQEEFYNIYPNPFSDFATINFNKNSNYNIKVYDIIGSLIKCYDISGEVSLLDMRESSDGVYFVVIEDTKTLKSDVKKIVVNKK